MHLFLNEPSISIHPAFSFHIFYFILFSRPSEKERGKRIMPLFSFISLSIAIDAAHSTSTIFPYIEAENTAALLSLSLGFGYVQPLSAALFPHIFCKASGCLYTVFFHPGSFSAAGDFHFVTSSLLDKKLDQFFRLAF